MDCASESLKRVLAASSKREKATPTHHMRERIAVAIRGSRPSYLEIPPIEAYDVYLRETERMRAFYEEWTDRMLAHFDVLDIEVVDTRSE